MKYLFIFLAAIVLLGGGIFLINKQAPSSLENKPWIEVVKPAVFELDSRSGQILREFKTGDEVEVGRTIEGKDGALANIYFPDGAVVRIPGASKFVIDEFSFDAKTEKVTTRISLVVGRLWNKILELATPDSVWEVRTANAVATVRGTAFGVEVVNGTSKFIGSEHKVEVAPIDTKTKKVIKEAAAFITGGNKLEIAAADLIEVQKNTRALAMKIEGQARGAAAAVSAVAAKAAEDWVRSAEAADGKINQRVAELQELGFKAKELREEFRNSVRDVREEIKKETQESVKTLKSSLQGLKEGAAIKQAELKVDSEEIMRRMLRSKLEKFNLQDKARQMKEVGDKLKDGVPRVKEAPEALRAIKRSAQDILQNFSDDPQKNAELLKEVADKTAQLSGAVAPAVRNILAQKLFISANNTADKITEGEKIVFNARAVGADGTSVDVTQVAVWKVLGPIGSFAAPGVFVAKITDVSIAEFGEAAGMIVAMYRDPATGNEFLAKSANIIVVAKITDEAPMDIGGQ